MSSRAKVDMTAPPLLERSPPLDSGVHAPRRALSTTPKTRAHARSPNLHQPASPSCSPPASRSLRLSSPNVSSRSPHPSRLPLRLETPSSRQSAPDTPASLASTPDKVKSPPQARRLQLRRAGFRAAFLSSTPLPPIATASSPPPGIISGPSPPASAPERSRSNSQLSAQYNNSSSGAILQALGRSTRSRRPTRSTVDLVSVFQDSLSGPPSPKRPDPPLSQPTSPPLDDHLLNDAMFAMREVSGNERAQPPSAKSFRFKTGRRRSKRTSNQRAPSSSFDAGAYIDALEAELATTRTRLENLTATETITGQAATIRSLERQVQSLSQDAAEWASRFDERVEDEVFQRTQYEADLKAQVKHLEEDLDVKDMHLQELRGQMEEARHKLSKTESLEASLGKRVDVLTELLAQSPTRGDSPSSLTPFAERVTSPKRLSRPSLPVIPLSPPLRRTSRDRLADEIMGAHDLRHSTSNITEHTASTARDHLRPGVRRASTMSATASPSSNMAGPLPSRPLSMMSNTSCDLSVLDDLRVSERPRRTRRFALGSTGLKPLILPNTTAAVPKAGAVSGATTDSEAIACKLSPSRVNIEHDRSALELIAPDSPSPSGPPLRRRRASWTPTSLDVDIDDCNSDDPQDLADPVSEPDSPPREEPQTPESRSSIRRGRSRRDSSFPLALAGLSLQAELGLADEDALGRTSFGTVAAESARISDMHVANHDYRSLRRVRALSADQQMALMLRPSHPFTQPLAMRRPSSAALPRFSLQTLRLIIHRVARLLWNIRREAPELAQRFVLNVWLRSRALIRTFALWLLRRTDPQLAPALARMSFCLQDDESRRYGWAEEQALHQLGPSGAVCRAMSLPQAEHHMKGMDLEAATIPFAGLEQLMAGSDLDEKRRRSYRLSRIASLDWV